MKKISTLVMLIALIISCGQNKKEQSTPEKSTEKQEHSELWTKAKSLFASLPENAETEKYKLTEEKIVLGKNLYFDTRLSKDNRQSCNTCHNLNKYGVDNLPTSAGNDGEFGDRNSPTTLNAALHLAQFWDGREPDVEAQAGGPILNPIEMAMPSKEEVEKRLSADEEYQKLFAEAFPGDDNPISYENLQLAIGAFERDLLTPSAFDDFINGNEMALNDAEKEGLNIFINSGCITCHAGNLLGGNMYQKFGLFADYWEHTGSENIDEGRFAVTGNESDKYFFKVPSLRNVEKTYPYFHDGSVNSLTEAIKIMGKTQLNKDISDEDAKKIEMFLATLTADVKSEHKRLDISSN